MTRKSDHSNVRIPPPLIYISGLALGAWLERAFPVASLSSKAGAVAAILLMVVAIVLGLWSVALFRSAHTSVVPVRSTTAIVAAGPYRFTRNPMYVAMACLYVGLALWFDMFWALVLLPVVIVVMRYYVIAREERYLERKFGDAYLQYKARVRRWL